MKSRMTKVIGVAALSTVCLFGAFFAFIMWPGPAITVKLNSPEQTIDGFGASATGYAGSFSADQADRYFSRNDGLGLSLLRLEIIPGHLAEDCGCVANNASAKCVLGTKTQIVAGDLQIAELAATRGARVIAVPWSPPAEMKTSGKFCSSGNMIGNSNNYAAYAETLASFPGLVKAHGISLDALSVQNEPDVANQEYDTCVWNGEQMHDFIPYLAGALKNVGEGDVKIGMPEESEWTFEKMNATMSDPAVAADVGLIFGHAYAVRQRDIPGVPSVGSRHVWQTEVSSPYSYNGSMKDALYWGQSLHKYLSQGANAWMYWNLDCGTTYYNHDNNMCLTDQNSHLAKRAYVLGQYAKFIRPGWKRVDVTNRGALLVTAYKGPDKAFAIVAINTRRWAARNQRFILDGITAQRTQVVPWMTSSSVSLSPQAPISATSGGRVIAYTIPARSVVTFQITGD